MSKQALYHYAENLHLIQRATFTDHTGKVRGLGENGRDLLVFLCNAANDKQDLCFHMGNQYIAEETGIHIATVKRLMAGLEQLGWITRTGELVRHMGRGAPTVEYRLTFYTPLARNERTGSQTSSHMATDNLGKALQGNEPSQKLVTETEPKPETEPQPKPDLGSGQERQGKEWGKFHYEVLAECLAWEKANFTGIDRGGLAKTWEKAYRPLIALAIETSPQATLADQVSWCVQQRNANRPKPTTQATPTQTRHLPDPPTGRPDCEHGCDNGIHMLRDEAGIASPRKCVCNGGTYSATQEPTPERVSPDKGANTYIPTPGGSADPQSDPVRELAKQFRKVG